MDGQFERMKRMGNIQFKTSQEVEEEKLYRQRLSRLRELKNLLLETDYVTLPDYDKEKPEILTQRAEWRSEVREIENLIKSE